MLALWLAQKFHGKDKNDLDLVIFSIRWVSGIA